MQLETGATEYLTDTHYLINLPQTAVSKIIRKQVFPTMLLIYVLQVAQKILGLLRTSILI